MKKLTNVAVICLVAITSHLVTAWKYASPVTESSETGRVTGVGGVFFKTKDPKALKAWYEENLGFATNDYGTVFRFGNLDEGNSRGYLQWGPFSEKSSYFANEFMFNYRVLNLEGLLKKLEAKGVNTLDDIEHTSYGKFVHIEDLEGRKIQLWEPVDEDFEKHLGQAVMGY